MEIGEVRDLLRGVEGLGNIWFGIMRMDNVREWAACLFDKRVEPGWAVGGDRARSADVRAYSLELRLGMDAAESRRAAGLIYDGVRRVFVEDGFIRPEAGAAVCFGSDAAGVFEYQIDFELYVNKNRGY